MGRALSRKRGPVTQCQLSTSSNPHPFSRLPSQFPKGSKRFTGHYELGGLSCSSASSVRVTNSFLPYPPSTRKHGAALMKCQGGHGSLLVSLCWDTHYSSTGLASLRIGECGSLSHHDQGLGWAWKRHAAPVPANQACLWLPRTKR